MSVNVGEAQDKPVLGLPPPTPSHRDLKDCTDCPRWGLRGKVCSLCKTL